MVLVVIKWRRMRCLGHVARLCKKINSYKSSDWKPEVKFRCRWEDNIKTYLKEMEFRLDSYDSGNIFGLRTSWRNFEQLSGYCIVEKVYFSWSLYFHFISRAVILHIYLYVRYNKWIWWIWPFPIICFPLSTEKVQTSTRNITIRANGQNPRLRSIHYIETTGTITLAQPQLMDSIKNCLSVCIRSKRLHVTRNQYFLFNICPTACSEHVGCR
jgi:hypothetical protein